jgi:hypothetical protein
MAKASFTMTCGMGEQLFQAVARLAKIRAQIG